VRNARRVRKAAQIFGHVTVDPIINSAVEAVLQPVGRAPVDEECPLIKLGWGIAEVSQSEVRDLFAALTLLNLPPGNVYVDQHVCRGQDERSPGPQSHDQSSDTTASLFANCPQALGIEKIFHFPRVHPAKDRIFGEYGCELLLQFAGRQKRGFRLDDCGGRQGGKQVV
jgi:hypothetical protein